MAEPFIGEVDLYGFNFAPEHWNRCEGQVLQISTYQALYSLLGTAYGGDGRTTFALPDLRGRLPISQGRFPGSAYDHGMGDSLGSETVTLTNASLATHAHLATFTATVETAAQWQVSTSPATKDQPQTGNYLAYNDGGRNPGVFMYKDNPTTKVDLNGVSGDATIIKGNVSIDNRGASQPFHIMQSSLTANFCIAMQGLFPSRS